MDKARNHHYQQTDTRTENKTLHVFTYKWQLKNENTWIQGGEQPIPGPVRKRGARDGIALGEIPNVDHGVIDAANHHGKCITI